MSAPDVVVHLMGDSHLAQAPDRQVPISIGTIPALPALAERCRDAGCAFVDLADFDPARWSRPALLWDFGSIARLPSSLARVPFTRVVSWCLESPLVSDRAYRRLPAIAAASTSVHGYRGGRELCGPRRDRFVDLFWPSDVATPPSDDWAARRFLCLVNSNKRAHAVRGIFDIRRPYVTGRWVVASTLAVARRRTGWRVPDFYAQRVQAVRHFIRRSDFTLYGVGWDRGIPGFSAEEGRLLQTRYGGAPADKSAVLAEHRFALCYENTAFRGYVSEKLFDCLFAGTIPVYLGAPDVDELIPSGCFIDGRDFPDLDDLEGYLRAVTPEQAARAREAATRFLDSPDFDRFRTERFVAQMWTALGFGGD